MLDVVGAVDVYLPAGHITGCFTQIFAVATQNIPVVDVDVQSAVPHLQPKPAPTVLIVTPSVAAHVICGRSRQLTSSFSTLFAYLPARQVEQDEVIENDISGFAMNFPAGQHPSRPLLPTIIADHLLPHNVRLNPLERSATKDKKDKLRKIKWLLDIYELRTDF